MSDGTFDRAYQLAEGFPHSKPSIITDAGPLAVGGMRRFVVQTFRIPDAGDQVFIEIIGPDGSERFALPPRVSRTLKEQSRRLDKAARSAAAKERARVNKANGWVPFFAARKENNGNT